MEEQAEKMRHTLSHVMAAAVQELYPTTTFGVGPAIENGFYYDMDFGGEKVTDADLKKIEKKMRGIIARGCEMVRREVPRAEALEWAQKSGQKYKVELIEDLPGEEKITFYDLRDAREKKVLFTDLCKGPHLKDLTEGGAWQLTRIAGAYWRGDEKREMLTRIYGVAFATEEELQAYLKQQEEAKARDHRKLGRELDLFCSSELVGSGLPLFTPRGTVLRDMLNELAQGYRVRCGYRKVCIPHIANIDLYKTSGHLQKFPELLQFVSQESGDHLAIKPVSCPHHTQIFASAPRSYKELPVKYLETTMVYRDERKGELGGLSRVRAITQDEVWRIFLEQREVVCADEYLKQGCSFSSENLPFFYFVRAAGRSAAGAAEFLAGYGFSSRVRGRLIRRFSEFSRESCLFLPIGDVQSEAAEMKRGFAAMLREGRLVIEDPRGRNGRCLRYALLAVRSLSAEEVVRLREFLLSELLVLYEREFLDPACSCSVKTEFRKAVCWVDEALYLMEGGV